MSVTHGALTWSFMRRIVTIARVGRRFITVQLDCGHIYVTGPAAPLAVGMVVQCGYCAREME